MRADAVPGVVLCMERTGGSAATDEHRGPAAQGTADRGQRPQAGSEHAVDLFIITLTNMAVRA